MSDRLDITHSGLYRAVRGCEPDEAHDALSLVERAVFTQQTKNSNDLHNQQEKPYWLMSLVETRQEPSRAELSRAEPSLFHDIFRSAGRDPVGRRQDKVAYPASSCTSGDND